MQTRFDRRAINVLPDLSREIIGCAMRVHSNLGPGLLESVYEECLAAELTLGGLESRRQVVVPVTYRGKPVESSLRVDLLIQDRVIVEVKAVERILPVHEAQLLTYLKICRKPLGLLFNFHVAHLRHGIRRRVYTVERRDPGLPATAGNATVL